MALCTRTSRPTAPGRRNCSTNSAIFHRRTGWGSTSGERRRRFFRSWSDQQPESNPAVLTNRQLDVALLCRPLLHHAEVASRLYISAKPPITTSSAVLMKMGLPSAVPLVVGAD